jgi:hypothetical protein
LVAEQVSADKAITALADRLEPVAVVAEKGLLDQESTAVLALHLLVDTMLAAVAVVPSLMKA